MFEPLQPRSPRGSQPPHSWLAARPASRTIDTRRLLLATRPGIAGPAATALCNTGIDLRPYLYGPTTPPRRQRRDRPRGARRPLHRPRRGPRYAPTPPSGHAERSIHAGRKSEPHAVHPGPPGGVPRRLRRDLRDPGRRGEPVPRCRWRPAVAHTDRLQRSAPGRNRRRNGGPAGVRRTTVCPPRLRQLRSRGLGGHGRPPAGDGLSGTGVHRWLGRATGRAPGGADPRGGGTRGRQRRRGRPHDPRRRRSCAERPPGARGGRRRSRRSCCAAPTVSTRRSAMARWCGAPRRCPARVQRCVRCSATVSTPGRSRVTSWSARSPWIWTTANGGGHRRCVCTRWTKD